MVSEFYKLSLTKPLSFLQKVFSIVGTMLCKNSAISSPSTEDAAAHNPNLKIVKTYLSI